MLFESVLPIANLDNNVVSSVTYGYNDIVNFTIISENISFLPWMLLIFVILAAIPVSITILLYPTKLIARWLGEKKSTSLIRRKLLIMFTTLVSFFTITAFFELLFVSRQAEMYEIGTSRLMFVVLVVPTFIYVLIKNFELIK